MSKYNTDSSPSHDIPSSDTLRYEISSPETITDALQTRDLTEEGSGHVVNLMRLAIQEQLAVCGFPNLACVRCSPIAATADNFDRLGFSTDHSGRSSTYTRYVDSEHVLQTQTSTSVPSALDELARHPEVEDITLLFPGLAYRRDVIDRKHTDVFHQMDIWRIQKNNNRLPLSTADLEDLVRTVFTGAGLEHEPIIYPGSLPYMTNSIEVYVRSGDSELKLLAAGLAHPGILAASGLDPEEYSGLALVVGLDHLVMARKGVPDIRFLRAGNPQIGSQMYDLRSFELTSNRPAVRRDLSYVLPAHAARPEDISEGLRHAFGMNAYLIEEATVKTIVGPEELHPNAVMRLGIGEGQVNVVVSVLLRHPDRTLTRQEVNNLYNKVYPLLHCGSGLGYVG